MTNSTDDAAAGVDPQPLRDGDTSIETDAVNDPAQAEWDRTTALDAGISQEELDAVTATGLDPDEFSPDDQIPASDLPSQAAQPESQGADPVLADIGEDGQGDVSPQDL